ncbi:MAG: mechanosensitive ion channel family protein [Nannocystaceae bacterium]
MNEELSAGVDGLIDKLAGWLRELIAMAPNLLLALLVLVVFGFLARRIERLSRRLFARLSGQESLTDLLAGLARVITVLVGLFIALELLHLDKTVTSILAGVGVVGLALGFAFQDIAANFMSGVIMAVRRPFAHGDLVEIAGVLGTITEVELRATHLRALEGHDVMVPNREVFQNKIINYTRTPERRVDLEVGIAYGDDLRKVREVTLAALEAHPDRDGSKELKLYFTGFGESSIDFVVQMWIGRADQAAFLAARSEAIIRVKEAFDGEGITIPFPIRTLDFGAKVVGGESLRDEPLRIAREG